MIVGTENNTFGTENRIFGTENTIFGTETNISGTEHLFGNEHTAFDTENSIFGTQKHIFDRKTIFSQSTVLKQIVRFAQPSIYQKRVRIIVQEWSKNDTGRLELHVGAGLGG